MTSVNEDQKDSTLLFSVLLVNIMSSFPPVAVARERADHNLSFVVDSR